MYDRYFEDTDEYTTREVLERAYALGVTSVCGDKNKDAYELLKQNSPDAYDETIVQLAYDEGRASALELEATETDDETIWERLVEREFDGSVDTSPAPAADIPEAIQPAEGSRIADGLPPQLDLPSFLRR